MTSQGNFIFHLFIKRCGDFSSLFSAGSPSKRLSIAPAGHLHTPMKLSAMQIKMVKPNIRILTK